MNKLAKEILSKHYSKILVNHSKYRISKDIIEAMQDYYETKLAEITDEDIEAYADRLADAGSLNDFERGEWLGVKEGAKAMRDGLIKHINL